MSSGFSTPIELLKLGDKGAYYAIKRLKHYDSREKLDEFAEKIKAKLAETSNARWDLAILLADLVRSGAWCAYYHTTLTLYQNWLVKNPGAKLSDSPYYFNGSEGAVGTHSLSFFTFLKENFGIGRTAAYNYLEVVGEFCTFIPERDDAGRALNGDGTYQIGAEAKFFQFWQLVEMVSLTYEQRKAIQPNWTREMIRAYKKELKEKEKPKKEIQPAEQVEAEEKPLTEAQQRFAKYSKDDLIDKVVELEAQIAEFKKSEERKNTLYHEKVRLEDKVVRLTEDNPFTNPNRTASKREIQGVIEEFIKSYDYDIKLHGRAQGAKAFAGNIARKLMDKYGSAVKATKKVVSAASERQQYTQEQLPV